LRAINFSLSRAVVRTTNSYVNKLQKIPSTTGRFALGWTMYEVTAWDANWRNWWNKV